MPDLRGAIPDPYTAFLLSSPLTARLEILHILNYKQVGCVALR